MLSGLGFYGPGFGEILMLLLALVFNVMLLVGLILIVLTRMMCLECGSDLREVGIVSDRGKRRDLVWRVGNIAADRVVGCDWCDYSC